MRRVTIYRSWTVIVEMGDIQALAPDKDMGPLISDIGGVLAGAFDKSLVGFTWDYEQERLLVTLKTHEQAETLANTWDRLVETVMPH